MQPDLELSILIAAGGVIVAMVKLEFEPSFLLCIITFYFIIASSDIIFKPYQKSRILTFKSRKDPRAGYQLFSQKSNRVQEVFLKRFLKWITKLFGLFTRKTH